MSQGRPEWGTAYEMVENAAGCLVEGSRAVYDQCVASVGGSSSEIFHQYRNGYLKGLHLAADSAVGLGAMVALSCSLAASEESDVADPPIACSQYIDDSDLTLLLAKEDDPEAVKDDVEAKIEDWSRSTIDSYKSGSGLSLGMYLGTIDSGPLRVDEMLKGIRAWR